MADYYGTDTVVSELLEDGLLIIRINRPDVRTPSTAPPPRP